MNTIISKPILITVLTIALMATVNMASADTTNGNLSSGIGGTTGPNVNGVVVTAPSASPQAGLFTSSQSVTLTASGSTNIYYTVNDTTAPTCGTGTLYAGPITVDTSSVIEAIACYVDSTNGSVHPSSVASFQYAINPPTTVTTTSTGGGGGGGGGSVSSSGGGSSSLFSKGDANLDGHINLLDFVILMANWGKTGVNNPADFNSDGVVDIKDFVILMANWTN